MGTGGELWLLGKEVCEGEIRSCDRSSSVWHLHSRNSEL